MVCRWFDYCCGRRMNKMKKNGILLKSDQSISILVVYGSINNRCMFLEKEMGKKVLVCLCVFVNGMCREEEISRTIIWVLLFQLCGTIPCSTFYCYSNCCLQQFEAPKSCLLDILDEYPCIATGFYSDRSFSDKRKFIGYKWKIIKVRGGKSCPIGKFWVIFDTFLKVWGIFCPLAFIWWAFTGKR